ncbi:MAG: bifunctional DNA primase/polymerase [Actinomycetes bacterium]
MSILKHARIYRNWGFNVIPLTERTPRFKWEKNKATFLSNDEFESAFKQGGITGIAMILGSSSNNTFSRDFDVSASYAGWQDAYSDFAKVLPISSTPHSGYHIFGRSKGVPTITLDDGELRGEGVLANLPPSTVNGKPYQWINEIYNGNIFECDPFEIGLAKVWTPTIQPLHVVKAVKCRKVTQPEIRTIEDVIAVSLPIRPRMNDEMALVFAQAVRSLEKHLNTTLSENELIEAIKKWYDGASKRGFTRDPYECYEVKFLRACKNIIYPLGYNILAPAFEIAPLAKPPKVALEIGLSQSATALATFFREAQRVVGIEKSFFVSCDDISKMLPSMRGMDTKNVHAIIQTLKRRGLIDIPDRGSPRTKEYPRGKAATYRYLYPLDDT